ncbi:MAG TPA: hypothetical protein VGE93_00440 [Bryobacteraceae bacterium]
MSNVLWEAPVASTGFVIGPVFQEHPGRTVLVSFDFENDRDRLTKAEVTFFKLVQFHITYEAALRIEMFEAYDKIIELFDSEELQDLTEALGRKKIPYPSRVRHFRLCFDGGPCFDMFGESIEVRYSDGFSTQL